MKDGSLAVLLVEQRVDIALDVSSRCVIMERGRIAHQGSSESLRQSDARIAELMGLSD